MRFVSILTTMLGKLACRIGFHDWHVAEIGDGVATYYCKRCSKEDRINLYGI